MNVKLEINFLFQYFLAPELHVVASSLEKCQNFSTMSTPPTLYLSHIYFKRKMMFIINIIILLFNDENL